jgi:GT2 family glycosyltransferase
VSDPLQPADVTIVVLNWNRAADTLACLASLRQADIDGATVLVVDNGSRDGSVAAVRAQFPDVQVLALAENRGYAGGNNAGIRAALEAGARAVLLLNNDTEVAPDFLLGLRWALDSQPRAAGACSAIHRRDRPEMLDVAFAEVDFRQRDAVKIRGVNALPGEGFAARREVDVAVGCSLLLRAEALRAIGLFDEAYFAYHEDVDWCLRARRAGWVLLYEPLSRVFHRGSSSTGALAATPAAGGGLGLPDLPNAEPLPWNPVRTYLGARNLVRLLRAHATRGEQLAFARACATGIPLELLAVVKGREGWLRLGRWGYRDFLVQHFIDRHPILSTPRPGAFAAIARAAAALVLVPVDLCWTLPAEIVAAHRRGRFEQFLAYLRGLRDGVLDRPLPLERLGLR